MKNPTPRQVFAEEIKREVLRDLNRSFGQQNQQQHLIDSIKQEVLLEMGTYRPGSQPYPDRVFVDAVKNEVLAEIRGGVQPGPGAPGNPGYPDRAAIESVKSEVIAQIEAEQERQEDLYALEQEKAAAQQQHQSPDPALVQAVKDSVLAEMHLPRYR